MQICQWIVSSFNANANESMQTSNALLMSLLHSPYNHNQNQLFTLHIFNTYTWILLWMN